MYFFDLLKVFGGYATLYKQGFAFHVKKNKAILLPFNEMGEESKKFSFTKCFKRTKTFVFTHSGAEHLFLAAPFHALISAYFMRKNSNMEERSLLYLTNGDELRVCTTVEFYFNFFLLNEKLLCQPSLYHSGLTALNKSGKHKYRSHIHIKIPLPLIFIFKKCFKFNFIYVCTDDNESACYICATEANVVFIRNIVKVYPLSVCCRNYSLCS